MVRIRNWNWMTLALVGLLSALAAHADSGLGRHKKMYAVPCPGKVVVDGKLDDWDLSGQILTYVVQETSDMQSARFALMYDADALYLSGVVRDPSPMMNRHNPQANGDWGWDADCCQFRMVLDPKQPYPAKGSLYGPKDQNRNDQMAHLTMWYYTDKQEPALHMQFGMTYELPKAGYGPFGIVPRDKYEAVYRKDADGRGFTFEYRIPWKTLEARNPPKGGDLVAGTVQFNWSEPSGLKTAGGAAWAYDVMSGPGFTFQSAECWGKIIFSEKGKLPREIVEEGLPPERTLPLSFSYEVPEDSEVTIALVEDNGMIARSLVSQGARRAGKNVERWDGLDDDGKPLPAGAYSWKGLYHKPITTKYLFSIHNSGQPGHKTDDNTGGWGGDHGWPTTVCPVQDGMLLAWHCCESGWGLIRTDLKGRKQWGNKHNAKFLATDGSRIFIAGDSGYNGENSVTVFDIKDGCPMAWGNGQPVLAVPPGGDAKSDIATGVAYHNGIVYVSWCARNLMGLYDAKSGNLKETWNVPAPRDLAVRPDGTLLVVSENAEQAQVYRKNAAAIYPVRSAAIGGKILAVSQGKAVPLCSDHLDEPAGVAVGKEGTIYVANWGKLHNVSVFAADGKYLRSIGKEGGRPQIGLYDKSGMLHPAGIGLDQQDRLWVAECGIGPKRMSVWDAKSGELAQEFFGGAYYSTHVWIDSDRPDEAYCESVLYKINLDKNTWYPHSTIWRVVDPNSPDGEGSGYGGLRVITAKNGRQYGWAAQYAKGNCLYIRQGDIFKPYLMAFYLTNDHECTPWPPYPLMGDIKRYPKGQYVWVDRNDDGILQHDEITRQDGVLFFHWVDKDLNLWSASGGVYRPLRIEADGRPVYDFTKVEKVPVTGNNGQAPLVVDAEDGTLYNNSPGETPGFGRWAPDGKKLLWGYRGAIPWPKAMTKPPAQPGKLWGPTTQLGVAGDFTGLALYFGVFQVYTRSDGLFAAMLFRDSRTSGGLGADVNACENFAGQLVKPKGMNRYFLLCGDQDGRVSEILGLDTIKRLPGGKYVHTPEMAKKAADALAEFERLVAKGQRLDIVRGRNGLRFAKAVTKFIDPQRNFSVRAAYDDKNLYVSYDVTSAHELTNAISDPHLIFKGGNLLDIQVAADAGADPRRKTPAPGDTRILITRQQGKPMAVVFRSKVRDFKGQPIVLTSPANKESFDAIEVTDRIALEYQKGSGTFNAVAAIPLDLLGWAPKPGATVRMDVGYLFGNASGTQVGQRSYWSNNSFSANVTSDVPNESRLEPQEWGTAGVE